MNSRIPKAYYQPAFLICVAVLAVAAAAKTVIVNWLGIHLEKSPLQISKPLELMDQQKLAPYKVVRRRTIKNRDELEALGTEEYIQWEMEDTEQSQTSSVRYCSVFITYYGLADKVPHRPEECYTGGGKQLTSADSVMIKIENHADNTSISVPKKIEAKFLTFSDTGQDAFLKEPEFNVFYFFNVNGKYASSRTEVRKIFAENLFGRYSYFSKVEWRFYGIGPSGIIVPSKNDSIQASSRLLLKLLPLMEAEHWPDWEQLNNSN